MLNSSVSSGNSGKSKALAIFLLLLSIVIVYCSQFYLLNKLPTSFKTNIQLTTLLSNYSTYTKTIPRVDHEKSTKTQEYNKISNVYESGVWLINLDVLQRSVILTEREKRTLYFESLVHFKRPLTDYTQFSKCVFKMGQSPERLIKKPQQVVHIEDYGGYAIFSVKCVLTVKEYLDNRRSQIFLAIVDQDKFNESTTFYHKPRFFNFSKPYLNALVNCVNALRNTDKLYHQIDSWIKINKAIGVDRIKLCAIDYDSKEINKLKETYLDYLDVFEYEISTVKICAYLGLTRNWIECPDYYKGFFSQMSLHEKVCANDW